MISAGPDPAIDNPIARDPGSYRDPSGFVYRRGGRLLRQVNATFATEWDALVSSGLLADLQDGGLLIGHEMADHSLAAEPSRAHAVIAPEPLAFVSYPYEWTFGELRDAALLTLEVEARVRAAGFTLKDASAYNVQFRGGRPILIDTLSFERAVAGRPWIAYRQFCQHFLAPLALMAYRDARLGLLLREFVDGVPLDLASRLLPARTRLRFGLLSHLHLHARADRKYDRATRLAGGSADGSRPTPTMSELRRAALNDSLRSAVTKLRWQPVGTEWADYAENTSYGAEAAAAKDRAVDAILRSSKARRVWDLGANTGRFSRIAAALGREVVAFDIDPGAAERHYQQVRSDRTDRVLPLVMDIANPSPGLGWANVERSGLLERASADVVMALALVHHLAISRNVPLPAIAELFAGLAPEAIVEFVPKADPMVQFLLSSREDVFADYTLEGFRAAMASAFDTLSEVPLDGSPRIMFHLRRRP